MSAMNESVRAEGCSCSIDFVDTDEGMIVPQKITTVSTSPIAVGRCNRRDVEIITTQ
jgi:hypothetical protein